MFDDDNAAKEIDDDNDEDKSDVDGKREDVK